MITHDHWTAGGRVFTDTDNPKRRIWTRDATGKNVFDGEKYVPYIRKGNSIQFGNYELRLGSSGLEWYRDTKRLFGGAFYPEKYNLGWERKVSTVSSLQVVEEKTEGPTDYLRISYVIRTEDEEATIKIVLGGKETLQFAFDIKALATGGHRLLFETDAKGTALSMLESEGVLLENDYGKITWDKKEKDDHLVQGGIHLSIAIKEGQYSKFETKKVSPTEWGPDSPSYKGYEYNGDYTEEDATFGYYNGNMFYGCCSFEYDSDDITTADTITTVWWAGVASDWLNPSTVAARMQSSFANPWSDTNLPTNASWANERTPQEGVITYGHEIFGNGGDYETNLNADLETAIDADAGDKLESGDYINVCAFPDMSSGDYIHPNSPTLYIDWTAGGGGGDGRSTYNTRGGTLGTEHGMGLRMNSYRYDKHSKLWLIPWG